MTAKCPSLLCKQMCFCPFLLLFSTVHSEHETENRFLHCPKMGRKELRVLSSSAQFVTHSPFSLQTDQIAKRVATLCIPHMCISPSRPSSTRVRTKILRCVGCCSHTKSCAGIIINPLQNMFCVDFECCALLVF